MIKNVIFAGVLAVVAGCATTSPMDRAIEKGAVIDTTAKLELIGDTGLTEYSTNGTWISYWAPDGRKVVKITGTNKTTSLKWRVNGAGEFCEEWFSRQKKEFCGDASGNTVMKFENGDYANFNDGKMTRSGTYKRELGNKYNL